MPSHLAHKLTQLQIQYHAASLISLSDCAVQVYWILGSLAFSLSTLLHGPPLAYGMGFSWNETYVAWLGTYNPSCTEAKKHCWYFEGLYPSYYICRAYEDCCGSRCCVRALSIQRLWYFWFLLMMGVLFCCGAGFFIRRRMYPPLLVEEPTFNVSYTRQTPGPPPGPQQPGMPYYSDPGGIPTPAPSFHMQPNSPQGNPAFPPPPSYYNTPPPPYEQVVKSCK